MSGELIQGRYRLVELLGEGGMGRVWRAQDEILGRQIAVKEVVFPHGVSAAQRKELGERAMREARAAAKLTHPGIITVYDVLLHQGVPIIMMEFIDGPSLAEVIRREGRLTPARVARIGAMLLAALGEAHGAGVVHRDLKPANVMLTGERAILTDFGIASLAGEAVLTSSGAVIGTPAFMAPEQARALSAAPAWDLWALGATLYNAVEGHPPYTGHAMAILAALLAPDPPPSPTAAGPLVPVLAGLLHKDSARRLTHAQAAQAFSDVIAGRPVRDGRGDLPSQPLSGRRVGRRTAHSHTGRVNAVALGRLDGRDIAVTGGSDGSVRVWDLFSDRELGEPLTGYDSNRQVNAVALGRLDGKDIAVAGGDDRVVHMWDLTTGHPLGRPASPGRTRDIGRISSVTVGKLNGRDVAVTVDDENQLSGWDLVASWPLPDLTIRGFGSDIPIGWMAGTVGRLNDTMIFVSIGYSHKPRVWNLATGRQRDDLPTRIRQAVARWARHGVMTEKGPVNTVVLGEVDGRPVAVTLATKARFDAIRYYPTFLGERSRLWVWDLATLRLLGEPSIISPRATSVATGQLAGQPIAVTGCEDGTLRMWDLRKAGPVGKPLTGHSCPVTAVAVSASDGQAIAVTGGEDGSVRKWHLDLT